MFKMIVFDAEDVQVPKFSAQQSQDPVSEQGEDVV